jgi:hypothetical protein
VVREEVGSAPDVLRWETESAFSGPDEELVAVTRRRLCVGPDRDDELRALLQRHRPPRRRAVATLWWPGGAPG